VLISLRVSESPLLILYIFVYIGENSADGPRLPDPRLGEQTPAEESASPALEASWLPCCGDISSHHATYVRESTHRSLIDNFFFFFFFFFSFWPTQVESGESQAAAIT